MENFSSYFGVNNVHNNVKDPNDTFGYSEYLGKKGINEAKLKEFISLGIESPRNLKEAKLLAEAVGIPEHRSSVVAGQWALESARGKKTGGSNNFFGIKSHTESMRNRMSDDYGIELSSGDLVNTKEEVNNNLENTKSSFLNFKNPIEAFIGYKAFIETNPRYKKALSANNSLDYAKELKKAGYATESQYVNKLKPLVKEIDSNKDWDNIKDYSESVPRNPSISANTIPVKPDQKSMLASLDKWKAKQETAVDPDMFDDNHLVELSKKENPKELNDLSLKAPKKVDFGKLPEFRY